MEKMVIQLLDEKASFNEQLKLAHETMSSVPGVIAELKQVRAQKEKLETLCRELVAKRGEPSPPGVAEPAVESGSAEGAQAAAVPV